MSNDLQLAGPGPVVAARQRCVSMIHQQRFVRRKPVGIGYTEFIGSREALQRSPVLAQALPPEGVSSRWTDIGGIPDRPDWTVRVRCGTRRCGSLRILICWTDWRAGWLPGLPDAAIRRFCAGLHAEANGQPGRPANWPFPTWGGAAA